MTTQQRSELRRLEGLYGQRRGMLAYWQATDARNALRTCERMNATRGVDVFEQAVETLLTAKSPSVEKVIESRDPKQISDFVCSSARRMLSPNSRADGKRGSVTDHEVSFGDVTEAGEKAAVNEDPAALVDCAMNDRMMREAFASLGDRQLRFAVLERLEFGTSYGQLARKYLGDVSKQAAQKRIEGGVRRVEFYLRGLGAGEGCGEITVYLHAAAWRIDEIEEAVRDQVTAHLAHCTNCRDTVAQQRRALVGVGAFFPLPALGLIGTISAAGESLHGVFAAIHARTSEYAASLQATASQWAASPPRAGAAIATGALLITGGAVGIQQASTASESVASPPPIAAGPHRLLDPIDQPKPKVAKKRKSRPRAAKPAPAPRPVQTQSAPDPAPIDDGSSEFLPEAR